MASRRGKRTLIGLALGESSLLAAEVSGGESTSVRAAAEFPYPAGVEDPVAVGKALGEYLRSKGFNARQAVVGLPARRLAVKAKEVPPTDRATLNEMLRLQAEGEFAADLKDLVYDYEGEPGGSGVLLLATPRTNLDWAEGLCKGAGLNLVGITSTGIALGKATARANDAVVLSMVPGGAELTAHAGGRVTALRTVRSGTGFSGELKRAVLPVRGSANEMVVWGGEVAQNGVGLLIRRGEMPAIGVSSGDSAFAPAVAVALAGMEVGGLSVDFVDTKLAAPRERRVPRWVIAASVAGLLLVGGGVWAYTDLAREQAAVSKLKGDYDRNKKSYDAAKVFVDNASIAQGWHNTGPRYLECLREVTATFPADNESFGIELRVREVPVPKPTGAAAANAKPRQEGPPLLQCTLSGKTSNARQAQAVVDAFGRNPAFTAVKYLGSQDVQRGQAVTFSMSFNYQPAPPLPASTQPATVSNSNNSNRGGRSRRSQ